MVEYKQMQVYAQAKNAIQDLKKELKFKNETEVILYLASIREIYKDKITLNQHNEALEKVEELMNQASL